MIYMDILLASVIGYLLGGTSVLLTMYLLYDKLHPPEAAEPIPKPEAMAEYEQTIAMEDKKWLAEMADLLAYDGKGGGMSGDKENT